MSLFSHVLDVIKSGATDAETWVTGKAIPWFTSFLKSTAKAEVDAAMPIVQGIVQQEIGGLVTAASKQDFAGFAAAQAGIVAKAADALKASSINVAVTSLATAVNMASVAHPDVVAAAAAPGTTSQGAAAAPVAGA